MRFLKTKKGLVAVAMLVAVGGIAVAAYAFFSVTGSGSGTSTTPASLVPWNVTAYTDDNGPLYPGITHMLTIGSAVNANIGPVAVEHVTVSVSHVTGVSASCDTSAVQLAQGLSGTWALSAGSQTATFTYATPPLVAAGASVTLPADLEVAFVDNGADQDACEGAHVTLETTVS
jgi:hypothetical protein